MLKRIKGDIFKIAATTHTDFVVHGCNCFHTMGSGIAKTVKQLYPEAYEADLATPMAIRAKLGSWSDALTYSGFTIINLYTQYGYNNALQYSDHFEYDKFAEGLCNLALKYPGCNFLFPYIGIGRAGGNSDRIMPMLENFSDMVEVTGGSVSIVEFQA